ncbi:MAG: winged helix-turn-helix domain-containing protein [Trueperaceae bacterium]
MSNQVLVVEDDEALRELLGFHLSQAGFKVIEAGSLLEAWERYRGVAIIVLDWMLPDGSGVDWLKRLRTQTEAASLPVLMLTARASEMDKVTGLNAGADDYLSKPFSAAELVARLRALLRRPQPTQQYVIGELAVNSEQGTATLKQQRLQLTRREFELLTFLAAHPGRVFSRNELLDKVWGEDFVGTDRTVDQHIAQLRSLIGQDWVETVRGRGYRLVDPEYQ